MSCCRATPLLQTLSMSCSPGFFILRRVNCRQDMTRDHNRQVILSGRVSETSEALDGCGTDTGALAEP
jgi:hypothetical protein